VRWFTERADHWQKQATTEVGTETGRKLRQGIESRATGIHAPRGVTHVQNKWSDVPATPEGPIMERQATTVVAATKVSLSLSLGVDGELEEGVDGSQR
jgi:hypothetical protein